MMHTHFDSGSARACSRFCAANLADIEYFRRHHHASDTAPEPGCFACEEQKRAMENKRQQQERLLQAKMGR